MYVLTRKMMAEAEALADKSGQSYFHLMQNAGTGAAKFILKTVGVSGKRVVCLCGSGNNGGDGFIIADRLCREGAKATVVLTHQKPSTLIAQKAFSLLGEGVSVTEDASAIGDADIIVDAIFGTGLSREPDKRICDIFEAVNNSGATVFSVDIPSGIDADTGRVLSCAIKADYTIALSSYKYCHIVPRGIMHCGETVVLDIGIDDRIIEGFKGKIKVIERPTTKKRERVSHKGSYGTGVSVTGSYGMPGASIISGKAALRSGLGILKIATVKENYTACAAALPEAVFIPLESDGTTMLYENISLLKRELQRASAILIGCGLGISEDVKKITRELICSAEVPIIIDADGINNIADDIEFIKQVKAPIIMTPHPAEMSRLCGKTVAEIEDNRIEIATEFAMKYRVYLCLKGTNTVIATPKGEVFINVIGNAGMATGGSGDMLAGIILGLVARGEAVLDAVCAAVWFHSAAGDAARDELGETSMLPSDMIERLHRFF